MRLQKRNDHVTILIDGMNLFYRVFHSFNRFTNSSGFPTGAAYGYIDIISKFIESYLSNKIIVFWESGYNWRNKEDAGYKGNRSVDKFSDEDKEKFHQSLSSVQKLLTACGVLQIVKYPHEADDLIYLLTKHIYKDVIIVSNDKDFLQLVNDEWRIFVLKPKKGGGYDQIKEAEVQEKFGVPASQMANYLALVGDTADNVKGVRGIGPVSAVKLINDGYIRKSRIEEVFNPDQIKQFLHSLKLVKMDKVLDKIKLNSDDCIALIREFDLRMVTDLFNKFEFKKYKPENLKIFCNMKFKVSFVKHILLGQDGK